MSNVEYKPAEKILIHLTRPDAYASWGFRLQGGIDFSTPLSIQSVTPNGVSERCGLKAGDAILAINNCTSDAMTHDEAKAEIMRSQNDISMLVERGAVKIWKPAVTPLSELRPQELNTIKCATGEDISPVQKTSLAINKPPEEPCTIGSSHNRSAQPFGQPKSAIPNIVHAQYNTPIGLYSANNIADSYSQQTAGIQNQLQDLDIGDNPVGTRISGSGQILEQELPASDEGSITLSGTQAESSANDVPLSSQDPPPTASLIQNPSPLSSPDQNPPPTFSSSENPPPASSSFPSQSAVYEEQTGETPSFHGYTNPDKQSHTFKLLQEQMAEEEKQSPGFRSVSAPIAKPPSQKPQQPSMRCGGCDMLATGVIVKANGVPYHVACFKCTSCSVNLKQKGYFVVNDKLYCEIHAKRVAQPPGSNMVATAVYR